MTHFLWSCKILCANFQQSHPPLLSLYYHSTCLVLYGHFSSASTSETVSGSHRFLLELSSAGPAFSLFACICIRSLQSLFSWGYLIRPSLLTGPSSDLGSGDRELQEVLVQGPTAGQDEVCVAHTSPVTQKAPTLLSTHASRGWPTSWAFRWASCMTDSWGGSCSTELSCWKLCSRYRLPGGPVWSQLSSSAEDNQICTQREIERGNVLLKGLTMLSKLFITYSILNLHLG